MIKNYHICCFIISSIFFHNSLLSSSGNNKTLLVAPSPIDSNLYRHLSIEEAIKLNEKAAWAQIDAFRFLRNEGSNLSLGQRRQMVNEIARVRKSIYFFRLKHKIN